MDKQLLQETAHDLQDNFAELLFLFSSSLKQMDLFLNDIEKQKQHIPSYDEIKRIAGQYNTLLRNSIKTIQKISDKNPY